MYDSEGVTDSFLKPAYFGKQFQIKYWLIFRNFNRAFVCKM